MGSKLENPSEASKKLIDFGKLLCPDLPVSINSEITKLTGTILSQEANNVCSMDILGLGTMRIFPLEILQALELECIDKSLQLSPLLFGVHKLLAKRFEIKDWLLEVANSRGMLYGFWCIHEQKKSLESLLKFM